jgi:hypothetical protein
MNKFITFLLLALPLFYASCSTSGAYYRSGDKELALGPTSFLGEQIVGESDIETPQGVKIRTRGYATHNPDRKLTEAVQTAVVTDIVTDGVVKQAGMTKDTVLGIDNNNTSVELAKEGTNLKKVTDQGAVNIIKATPK